MTDDSVKEPEAATGSAPQETEAAAEEKPKPKRKPAAKKPAGKAKAEAAEAEEAVADEPVADADEPADEEAPAAEPVAEAEADAAEADDEPADADGSDDDEAEAKPAPRRRSRAKKDEEEAAPAPTRTRAPREPGEAVLVRAQAKYVRTSARKARLVCDHIRGKSVIEARAILAHTPRAVSRDWSKLLESAVANAENNHELIGDELRIASVTADEGPTLKRFRPRAMGRATKILKRTSHLTILLTPKEH